MKSNKLKVTGFIGLMLPPTGRTTPRQKRWYGWGVKQRSNNWRNKMEKLCIDVRGFSDEKKMWVQDAFFKLGFKWSSGCTYQYLDADQYGNVYSDGNAIDKLTCGIGLTERQRKYAITYPELMRKAGMDEGDPDVMEDEPPKKVGSLTLEVETDLQAIIGDYLFLLDSIKDPYARGVIKSQLTDLTDLQYQQLTGENENA